MWKAQRCFVAVTLIVSLLGCDESDIMHGLSEREANFLITRLGDSGVEAKKQFEGKDTWSVQVDQNLAVQAIKIISRVRSVDENIHKESQSGLFLSKEDRKFQLAKTLAHDIEQTLVVLSGIYDAKVHLNFPEVDPLLFGLVDSEVDQSVNEGSGSALLVVENERLYKKEDIAKLVSGASGIPEEKIAVWIVTDKIAIGRAISYSEGRVKKNPDAIVAKPVKESSQKGILESWKSIINFNLLGVVNLLSVHLKIFAGFALLVISLTSLIYIRTHRKKANSQDIPTYIP